MSDQELWLLHGYDAVQDRRRAERESERRIARMLAESDAEAHREWLSQGNPPPKFIDCDHDQKRELRRAVAEAYDAIKETYGLVRGRGTGKIPPGKYRYVNDAMIRQFPRLEGKRTHHDWVEQYTTSLAINAREILKGMSEGITIECECDCDTWPKPGNHVHGYVWPWSDTIHLCPKYWQDSFDGQVKTILHEASHAYAGTIDLPGDNPDIYWPTREWDRIPESATSWEWLYPDPEAGIKRIIRGISMQ